MPRPEKVRQLIADSNERLSIRVGELEKAEPMQAQTSKWVTAGVWALWPCWHRSSCRAYLSGCSSEPRKARRQNRAGATALPCRWSCLRGHGVAEPPRSHRHRDRVRGAYRARAAHGPGYTRQQCEDMLYGDLLKHAQALDCIKHPLTDGQKAAFVSFAFNVGNKALCDSTLPRKANAGDMAGPAELSRWTRAGGRELPGLVKRRQRSVSV